MPVIQGLDWINTELASLVLLFFMSVLTSWMVPLPQSPYMMWLGQFGFPVAVVLVSTVGSIVGWMCLEPLLRRQLEKRPHLVQKIPKAYRAVFLRRTGIFLFLFNAIPFPIDPIRFMAVANGYPRGRFMVAFTLGRLVRGIFLVGVGAALAHHTFAFWTALVLVMVVPLLISRFLQIEPAEALQETRAMLKAEVKCSAASKPPPYSPWPRSGGGVGDRLHTALTPQKPQRG